MRVLLEAYGLKLCRACDMPTGRLARGRPRDFCPAHASASTRQAFARKQRTQYETRRCDQCAAKYEVSTLSHQRYCCDQCRRAAHNQMLAMARRRIRACRDCGQAQLEKRHRLCQSCRQNYLRQRNARKNHARRAAGPPVDLMRLLELRGKRCHLCGKTIDLTLSGLLDDGLNIEHLIPVSHGGTNDLDNLHISHRRCNVARSNRGPAQLLLPTGETP